MNQVNDSRISNQAYENWASEQILKIMFRNDGQIPDVTSVEKWFEIMACKGGR